MRSPFKKFILSFALVSVAAFAGCTGKSDRLVRLPDDNSEKVDDEFDAGGFFTPKVDILFVVDNSGSMDAHQTNLQANIALFVNEITSNSLVDYRIAVTTTDDDNEGGTLITNPGNVLYVDKTTPNGSSILKTRLKVGTSSSSAYEQSFNPIWRAFSPPLSTGVNNGFLRKDAFLAVIFITDAEDQSPNTYPNMNPDSTVLFLDGLKGPGSWFTYGAILPVGNVPCQRSEDQPVELQRFLVMTKSPFFSLCAPDFGKNLAAVGANLVSKVGRTVLLDRFPVVDTIKISYGTQIIPRDYKTGWYYTPAQNSLTFGKDVKLTTQPTGTQLKITFVTKKRTS